MRQATLSAASRPFAPVPGRSRSDGMSAPSGKLWTQKEASEYLSVSCRYLRNTSCPRVELPGNGRKGRPVIRYSPAEVAAWAQARGIR